MNVKRCSVTIGRLIEQGFRIDFENQTLTGPHGRQAQGDRQRRLCHLRAHLRESGQTTQENPVWVDTQEHEHEMDWHAKDHKNGHICGEQMDGQTAKGVKEPRQPTEKEPREHSLTHVPCANWFKACVLARSKENPHRPRTQYERKHQDHDSACDCKVLVYTCATMVLAKGSGDRYAVHVLKQMIDEVGDPQAIFREILKERQSILLEQRQLFDLRVDMKCQSLVAEQRSG